jgi:hypothetical protein
MWSPRYIGPPGDPPSPPLKPGATNEQRDSPVKVVGGGGVVMGNVPKIPKPLEMNESDLDIMYEIIARLYTENMREEWSDFFLQFYPDAVDRFIQNGYENFAGALEVIASNQKEILSWRGEMSLRAILGEDLDRPPIRWTWYTNPNENREINQLYLIELSPTADGPDSGLAGKWVKRMVKKIELDGYNYGGLDAYGKLSKKIESLWEPKKDVPELRNIKAALKIHAAKVYVQFQKFVKKIQKEYLASILIETREDLSLGEARTLIEKEIVKDYNSAISWKEEKKNKEYKLWEDDDSADYTDFLRTFTFPDPLEEEIPDSELLTYFVENVENRTSAAQDDEYW